MYCTNCGTENSDGATFCNQCGAPLAREQSMPQQIVTKPKTPKSLIIGIVVVIIVCGVMASILLSKNRGKSEGNLDEIVRASVLCYQYGDVSYIEDYFEEGSNKDSYITFYRGYFLYGCRDEVDMDSITYNIVSSFEENNCTYAVVWVNVSIPEQDTFVEFSLHAYKKGKKWFLYDGRQKPQE